MPDSLEKMASKLRAAGWQVEPPLTQENCPHEIRQGSGSCGSDGSGHIESYCMRCGKHWREDWPPHPLTETAFLQNAVVAPSIVWR